MELAPVKFGSTLPRGKIRFDFISNWFEIFYTGPTLTSRCVRVEREGLKASLRMLTLNVKQNHLPLQCPFFFLISVYLTSFFLSDL